MPDPAGPERGSPERGRAERWIDSHCHLPEDPDARATAVADAGAAGVTALVTVGCDVPTSQACLAAAAATDPAGGVEVWATAGVHPHDARTVVLPSGGERISQQETGTIDLSAIEALLAEPRVVGVGECGLDYYYDHSPREQQRAVFAAQIALAHRHGLALVIHTRDAWEDTFAILDREGVPDRTVFHCFTGGPEEARRGLDLGISLSFSGIVTFKSARDLRAAAALCPSDRLLVETDSPYLTPVPYRGQRNRPALVPVVGEAVAAARGQSSASIAEVTTANARSLFQLS